MAWSIDLLALDGLTEAVHHAPYKTARVTWAKDGPGAVEIELTAAHAASGIWLPGQRRVRVNNAAGTTKFAGWLGRLERSGSPDAPTYRAAAKGLASILEKRVVVGDFSQVSVVGTTIATALLAHIDAQSNDQTNFTVGAITGTAATLTRYFCDGDIIMDAINELANRESGGFQWELTPAGAFTAWVGGRGTDYSATKTLAPGDVNDWNFIADEESTATYVMGIGDRNDDQPCGAPLQEVFDTLRTTRGRLEVVTSSDSLTDAELIEIAEDELRARVASRSHLTASWIEDNPNARPWTFGTVWLDDIVKVAAGAEFGGDQNMRCVSVSITLEPGVHEFVEMEFEAA
jgi:hypothetical protein